MMRNVHANVSVSVSVSVGVCVCVKGYSEQRVVRLELKD